MKLLILTTGNFAPTHTPKLLKQVIYLCDELGIDVLLRKDFPLDDLEQLIMTHSIDCVFPTTVFEYTQDGKDILCFNQRLYKILSYHKQPFIGSDLLVHQLLNDKALTNLRSGMGLPNNIVTRLLWENKKKFAIQSFYNYNFPVIIKPNTLAASLGIDENSIANGIDTLIEIINRQFLSFPNITEVLIEQYLSSAKEYTVSVTGNGENTIESVTALIPKTGQYELFSYKNKNLNATKRTLTYSSCIDEALRQTLKECAQRIAKNLGTRDLARFDFLVNYDGNIYLIDANSLPSLGSNYMKEYVDAGAIQEQQIMALILLVFCKRCHLPIPKSLKSMPCELLRYLI